MIPGSINDHIVSFWHSHLRENSSILVAVSGGSDSVALIHLLSRLKDTLKIRKLGIAHVNHGLRGEESDQDEVFVRGIATGLDIPLFTERLHGHSLHEAGLEIWARKERYRFFGSVKESGGFNFIATGHTADDQAETVLFRMLRGAGVRGLRGILPVREDGVIRPLLHVHKEQIVAWLNNEKIRFRTDSSNSDTHYSRNFIRHEIMTVINRYEHQAVERMTSLADQMQNTWGIVAQEINKWTAGYVIRLSAKSFILKKTGLEQGQIAVEGVRAVFEEYSIPFNQKHVEKVLDCGNRNGGFFLLPGGWHYQVAKERILFAADSIEKEEFLCVLPIPGTIECKKKNISFTITEEQCTVSEVIGNDKWSVLLDLDSVCGGTLVYRKIRFEDNFTPLGRNNTTPVLKFLAKQGFSKVVREGAGVIVDGDDRVVWIPGVRMNEKNAVRKTSGRVIKIVSRTLSNNI